MFFSLKPVTKQIIWGGDKLSREFGIGKEGESIAEAWELTCREDGDNLILDGEYKDRLFSEYLKENPNAIGKKNTLSKFPLLIKLIDARSDLSIQVHPDDEYASLHTTDYGKTEMWYIVDCEENAHLIYGLKDKYTREELENAIKEGTLENMMNYVDVHKGDVFFIPSNTVHAICSGILIAEIQQNSNITYRLYDYNRRQKDGSLRPLHIEDGLNCALRYEEGKIVSKRYGDTISDNPYFKVRVKEIKGSDILNSDENSFIHVMCIDGECDVSNSEKSIHVKKGGSIFMSANSDKYVLCSEGCKLVISSL